MSAIIPDAMADRIAAALSDAIGDVTSPSSHAPIEPFEPSTTVRLQGGDAETMLRLIDALEDLDDVQDVYANFDISDAVMEKMAA